METVLYVGNLLSLALLFLIVTLAYRTFWQAVALPVPPSDPRESVLFSDDDPDEQFWLIPTVGAVSVSPAAGIPVGSGVLVGRGQNCALRVNDPFVSEQHLRISGGRRACLIEDLDSANGYTVEGKSCTGESVLKDGQWFSVGDLTVRIERRRN